MARILVVGSRKSFDPAQFREACEAIGRAIAKHRHTVVAAGCGADDAETWVLDGANAAGSVNAKTPLIPFAPALPNTEDLIQTSSVGASVVRHTDGPLFGVEEHDRERPQKRS